MSNYKLKINNNSYRLGNICVYATVPDARVNDNLMSLAWLSKKAHPDTTVDFSWDLDYSFVWSETGKLTAGAKYLAAQILETDPSKIDTKKPNGVFFDKVNDAYVFSTDTHGITTDAGRMAIYTGPNVEEAKASIGIAIGGNPSLVVDSTPNFDFTFLPNIKYWVAFGDFEKGEVLDLNAMTNIYEIDFAVNEFEKEINLNSDNTWSEVV